MRNFIAQQVIFLGITSLLFNISCQNEKKESNLDSQSEWQEKSPKQKWDYTGNYQVTLPCADCKGIIVKLQLKKDNSYRIVQNYNENDSVAGEIKTETGQYQWSEINRNLKYQTMFCPGKILKLTESKKIAPKVIRYVEYKRTKYSSAT